MWLDSGRERDLIRLHYHLISREYMWLTARAVVVVSSAEASFYQALL